MRYREIITRTAGIAAALLALASCASSPADPATPGNAAPPSTTSTTKTNSTQAAKQACAVYYHAVEEVNKITDEFWASAPKNLEFTNVQFRGGPVIEMVTMERFWSLQVKKEMDLDLPENVKDSLNGYLEAEWARITSFFGDQTIDNLTKADENVGRAGKAASLACKQYR